MQNNTVRLIYAWGKEPFSISEDGNTGGISYHESRRGTKLTYLMEKTTFTVPDSPDVEYLDITAPNVIYFLIETAVLT